MFTFWLALILKYVKDSAREVGFEPTNAGTRTRCLTTWRLPNGAFEPNCLFRPR